MPRSKVLTVGSTGDDVRWVQQRLVRNGYPVAVNGVYDDETADAVRDFQATHLDSRGRPLGQDGEVGVRGVYTWWALEHPSRRSQAQPDAPATAQAARALIVAGLSARRQEVLRVACAEVGVREQPDGSNTGPRVKDYLDGFSPPPPWCALFVSWCLRGGDGSQPGALAFPPYRSRASVQKIAAWGAAGDKLIREPRYAPPRQVPVLADVTDLRDPQPGDVFLMLTAGGDGVDSGRGHTGFVLCLSGDGRRLITVEGNCGNAVRCRLRARTTIAGYVAVLS